MQPRLLSRTAWLLFTGTFWACAQIPETTETWEVLAPTGGTKWSARNAHASCAFKDVLWLTGGRSDLHPLYNLESSYKSADVWFSEDGADWTQISELRGDFFAQNYDAIQPGPVAPWYPRFAHSLTPLDTTGDGVNDIMVLMGGYAPNPINDVWITTDGLVWAFAGYADWSPRAWHGATSFKNSLWVVGGTPITNDVWYASNITYLDTRRAPLTRAMYLTYRYDVKWTKAGEAAWSPRAAMGLVTQYFKPEEDEAGYYRMVLVGGYGGYLDDARFDGGLRCREDVWVTNDGLTWNRTVESGIFGGLAFMGIVAWEPNTTFIEEKTQRIWIVGGGYIGETGNKHVLSMDASVNTYWTTDAIDWTLINFVQGGGISSLALYSSNEWARTTLDGVIIFLGVWGLTLQSFNPLDPSSGQPQYQNGALYILGGDQEGEGSLLNSVYRGSFGLRCQILGISCSGNGDCSEESAGCICYEGFTGEYCEDGVPIEDGAIKLSYSRVLLILCVAVGVAIPRL